MTTAELLSNKFIYADSFLEASRKTCGGRPAAEAVWRGGRAAHACTPPATSRGVRIDCFARALPRDRRFRGNAAFGRHTS